MVLSERIRNSSLASGRRGDTTKFNFSEFKQITDGTERMKYANDRLEFLGEGSARAVYVLTSKHVLKIATGASGVSQNKAEVSVFTNPKTKPIVATIFDFAKDYSWLSSELVNPFDTPEEIINSMPEIEEVGEWKEFATHAVHDYPSQTYIKMWAPQLVDFANAIGATADENNLVIGDVVKASSWGRSPDGRLVLLDYGFTEEVANKHY